VKLIQVFNRYLFTGGEEKSVDRAYAHLGENHEISRCFFESREWTQPGAPSKLSQLARLYYNPTARRRFAAAVEKHQPDVALFHNIYPVGSPALYHTAWQRRVPVIQYLHNFRPFSAGGTLYAKGQLLPEALRGNYWREIRLGAWQDSVVRTAFFALMLKLLHRSGWLESVKAWIAISEFMRDRLIEAGMDPGKIWALRHSWDAMPAAPAPEDGGYYLFLGRLVELKGIEVMLQAWDDLHRQLGPQTPPLHIGGEGPMEPIVKQHMQSNPSIRFLGLINGQKKADALRRCRALLAPSIWWEPLGLVVYEAYDYGKPVLAARAGGLTETVEPGMTGLTHAPGSVAELASSVLQMEALGGYQRIEMGRAGRRWLLREASVDAWKAKFDDILQAATSASHEPGQRALSNQPAAPDVANLRGV
jgi:glycosyltransferase involved in cell wall biosynthesis